MLPVAAISITDILANIYFVYGIYLYMDKYYIYYPAVSTSTELTHVYN